MSATKDLLFALISDPLSRAHPALALVSLEVLKGRGFSRAIGAHNKICHPELRDRALAKERSEGPV